MNFVKRVHAKINNIIWDRSVSLAHITHGLTHDYAYVDSIIKKFEAEGLATDRFQRYKLWFLLELLNKHKPKNILELGSGSSTALLSDYADKNGAKITSLETDAGWATLVRKYIGQNVSIIECSASGDANAQPKALRFDVDLGQQDFDLVIIDGPGDKFPGIGKKEGVTMNAVELSVLPKMIVVDGRNSTVQYLKNHPRLAGHSFTANDLYVKKLILPGYHFFAVFQQR